MPPPGLNPTISRIVLPSKYASASKAGSTGSGVEVGRGVAVGRAGSAVAPPSVEGAIAVGVAVGCAGTGVAVGRGVSVGSVPPHATRTAESARLSAPRAPIFLVTVIPPLPRAAAK